MTTDRPFRFGVVSAQPPRGKAWTDHARRVEELGFDTLVMPDNISNGLSVFPALAAAAAVTTRLRLGTYVLANDQHHPVQVAKDTVTLAVLSGGRFELGLGAGRPNAAADNAMLGLPFDAPGVRVSRLQEAIGLVKRLIAGETVTSVGGHHRLSEAKVVPWGVVPPEVPLLVAGAGRRMLALAGAEADSAALGVAPTASEAEIAERIGWVRDSGRDVELNVNLMAVGDRMPSYLAARLPAGALDGAVTAVSGDPAEAADQLRARRERLGISYVLVGDELMEAFAPVAAELAGE